MLPGKESLESVILGAGYIAVELAGVLHARVIRERPLWSHRDRPLRGFSSYIVGLIKMEEQNFTTSYSSCQVRKTAEGITIHSKMV